MLIQIENLDKTAQELHALITKSTNAKSCSIIVGGEKGIGKTSVVRNLCAKLLNSDQRVHLNLLWIDTENTKVSVTDIRSIYDFMYKTSYTNLPKIIVIDSIDVLNIQSLNALLKLLEEPSSNTYFILISHSATNIIKTIQSRCISIMLAPPQHLVAKDIINKQHPKLNESSIMQVLEIANFLPGLASNLIQYNVLEFYNDTVETLLSNSFTKFIEKHTITDENFEFFHIIISHLLTKSIKNSKDLDSIYFSESEKKLITKITNKYQTQYLISILEEINHLTYNALLVNLSLPNIALIILNKLKV